MDSKKIITESRITLKLALPIIVGQLGVMLMGVADTIQVGHIDNLAKESVGAAAIANGVYITVAIIGIIAMQVIAPMIAHAHHQNKKQEVIDFWQSGIRVAYLLGLFCFVVIEIIAFNFHWLGQKPEIEQLAVPYLHTISLSVFPTLLFAAYRQLSDGLGITKTAMYITLAGLLVNVVANSLLIYGSAFTPQLGLFGAGIATLLARIFMAVSLFIYLKRAKYFQSFWQERLELTHKKLEIIKVGIPSGLQGFFEIAVFAAAAVIIGKLGAVQLAAHQIAINPASCTYMMVTGVAAAGSIRVGAHKDSTLDMKLSGTVSLVISVLFMSFCCIIFLVFNHFIASLYINDESVMNMAAQLLIIAGFFQLSDGIQAVALGILRGMADVNIPTIITLFAYWVVGLPFGYYLAFTRHMGAQGIWYGLTLGLTASAILLTWRFYHNLAKKK